MRTIIYARYSSQLQNSRSIEDQITVCRERCAREGWEIVDVFTDYAISGAAGIDGSARPGLNALLARVEAGGVDQVLAEATDRIARHQGDAFAIRERILFAGARLFTLSDGEVTDITAAFKGLMDAQFRKELGAKIKRGQKGSVAQGRAPAGLAYGYRKANRLDADGELVRGLRAIDDDEADIVRRIFREYVAGRSPRAIAAQLNAEGVPGPRGATWRASTIGGDHTRQNGLLRNELYSGVLVHNRTRKVTDPRTRRTLIKANPEAEWFRQPVPELRIIDEVTWKAAQSVRTRYRDMPLTRTVRPKHLLSGIVRCGCCGGALSIVTGVYWGCGRARDGGGCENNRNISTARLEARVLDGLENQMLAPEVVEAYVREYHQEHARRSAEIGRERARIERRHREAAGKVERLVEAVANGGEEFVEIRAVLAKARAERDGRGRAGGAGGVAGDRPPSQDRGGLS